MNEVTPQELTEHIRHLFGVSADLIGKHPIQEEFRGEVVWDGVVHEFRVDHKDADTCYAWSSPVEGSDRRKFYAVLKKPPVDSPEAAVRASIVRDYRGKQNQCQ